MRLADRLAKLERTSSLDAGFLTLESPTTPMHIGSLSYLEPGPLRDENGRVRLGELRRLLDERLALAPRFRQRPVTGPFGLGRPVWMEDPHFSIANHVNEIVLPSPGSEQQLRELCGQLMMKLLDRSHPLWELWIVDGLADGSIVLIEKIHHSMMDGVSGVDVAMLMTDATPKVERTQRRARARAAGSGGSGDTGARRPPGRLTLLATGAIDELGVPLAMAGAPWRATAELGDALIHPSRLPELGRQARAIAKGSASLVQRRNIAPHTPLNDPVGPQRLYDHVEFPLPELKRIAKTFGCKVNDVLLAGVTNGLRQLMLDRELEPGDRFQVLVPVSTRALAEHLTFDNQVAAWIVALPVGVAGDLARLEAVKVSTAARREEHQADAVAALLSAADRWPTPLVQLIARLTHHQPFVNAVVTNVPGPPHQRYLLGARVKRVAPFVPLAGNLDVSIGIVSYDSEVSIGLLADAERCADVQVLGAGIRAGLESLEVLATRVRGAA